MRTTFLSGKTFTVAQAAAKLLGIELRPRNDIETEEWLFMMVLRLARRVESLEGQIGELEREREANNRQTPQTRIN